MKNLDVNVMGLQEMNRNEMVETEGGLIPLLVAAVVLLATSSCVTIVHPAPGSTVNVNSNNGNGNSAEVALPDSVSVSVN